MLQSEAPFLKEMLYESLYVPAGMKPYPRTVLEQPELSRYYLNWGSIPRDLAVVATSRGGLVAAVWGRAQLPSAKGFGYIDVDIPEIGIAVKPDFRNQGVGTTLIKKIFKRYNELGVRSVSLSVDRQNPAKRLYDRLGFQVVVENKHDFIMQKMLS